LFDRLLENKFFFLFVTHFLLLAVTAVSWATSHYTTQYTIQINQNMSFESLYSSQKKMVQPFKCTLGLLSFFVKINREIEK